MDPIDKDKTTLTCRKGTFRFNVMPFGLRNAPALFQRMMDEVLGDLRWKCCLVYIDDVIIFSTTFQQHIKDMNSVFKKLKEYNLSIKLSKCQFCADAITYLGFLISKDGIQTDP